MKKCRNILGPEHEGTLYSMAITVRAYNLGSRWKEAEELATQSNGDKQEGVRRKAFRYAEKHV